jgi:hypothetical protein
MGRIFMTDEKICPIISKPTWVDNNPPHRINEHIEVMEVKCLKEKCMAWVPECPWKDKKPCESFDCEYMDREYLECKGGCRLI